LAVAGTLKLKFPSASVDVPPFVPLTVTVAPAMGAPSVPVTLPVIVLLCAMADTVSMAKP